MVYSVSHHHLQIAFVSFSCLLEVSFISYRPAFVSSAKDSLRAHLVEMDCTTSYELLMLQRLISQVQASVLALLRQLSDNSKISRTAFSSETDSFMKTDY